MFEWKWKVVMRYASIFGVADGELRTADGVVVRCWF